MVLEKINDISEFTEFQQYIFNKDNHSEEDHDKDDSHITLSNDYKEVGQWPRFGGVSESSFLEDCRVGLMFIQANYTNCGDGQWKEKWENKNFSDAAGSYHDGMIKDWLRDNEKQNNQLRGREKVFQKIKEKLRIDNESIYITDYHKCKGQCDSKKLTKKEMQILQEESGIKLMILFGNDPKQSFQAGQLTTEVDGISYDDNLSNIHGYLFEHDRYNFKVLPLLFINQEKSTPRNSYMKYMNQGLGCANKKINW